MITKEEFLQLRIGDTVYLDGRPTEVTALNKNSFGLFINLFDIATSHMSLTPPKKITKKKFWKWAYITSSGKLFSSDYYCDDEFKGFDGHTEHEIKDAEQKWKREETMIEIERDE